MKVLCLILIVYIILRIQSTNDIGKRNREKLSYASYGKSINSFYHYFIKMKEQKCFPSNLSSLNLRYSQAFSSKKENIESFSTSVWCSSSDVSGLRCKFHNLCYFANKKQFIFIWSPSSIVYGLENSLQLSTELFSSSSNGHTAFKFNLASVNSSNIKNFRINFVYQNFLLFSRFKPDNLQHIFHDDLLPLYFTLKELSSDMNNIHPLVIDDFQFHEFDYLYKFLTKKIYFLTDFLSDSWTCFQETHIGLNLMSVFFNYYNGIMEKKYQRYFNANLLDSFVNSFLHSFNLFTHQKIDCIKVLIIERRTTRKILNISEVKKSVYSYLKLKNYKDPIVKIISFEDDGLFSIIKELQTTKILIGMHGAALILSIFLPNSSSLIELWPFGIKPTIVPVYKIACEIKGLNYKSWVNEDFCNSQVNFDYPKYYGGIANLTPEKFSLLNEKLKMTILNKVNCCDDPEWLLRIYQDTIVNVHSNNELKSTNIQDIIDEVLNTEGNSPLNSRLPFNILSQVEDTLCNINKKSGYMEMILSWSSPWNYIAIGCTKLNFEIVVKEFDEIKNERSLIYHTKEHMLMKKLSYQISDIYVWITPFCLKELGNVKFIDCKVV